MISLLDIDIEFSNVTFHLNLNTAGVAKSLHQLPGVMKVKMMVFNIKKEKQLQANERKKNSLI